MFLRILLKLLNFSDYIIRKVLKYITQKQIKIKDKLWDSIFLASDSYVFSMEDNVKIILYKDSKLSRLIYYGFEINEVNFIRKYLQPGDLFIDIGSNIGLFSLIASPILGDSGKVVAYEPTPRTYERFKQNINLNGYTNISVRNVGLSDTAGFLQLNVSDTGYDAWNTFAKETNKEKFNSVLEVKVLRLDDELLDLEKSNLKLIKIDVEGWEKFVLLGGKNIFTHFSPVVMIEFTEENTFAAGYYVYELYDLFISWGYNWYSYVDDKLVAQNKSLRYPYNNLLAIKNLEEVYSRLSILNKN